MIRNNKWKLLLTSAVILLPAVAGLLLWEQLPDEIATHWSVDGTADGWSGKAFAVFGLPLILLAVHWLCVLITAKDPGNQNQNRKAMGLVLWILPVMSLFSCGIVYAAALGREIRVEVLTMLLMGLLFIFIGNYLPKCRLNHTIGIRVKWTLQSEENWAATHRAGGLVWVAGGILLCLCGFTGMKAALWSMGVILPVLVLFPVAYSYSFYRKQLREGTLPAETKRTVPSKKRGIVIGVVIPAVVLAAALVLCFTGEIEVAYGEENFTLKASYYQDLTVAYETVDSVELWEESPPAMRVFGYGSPRLEMGRFSSDAFGDHLRYSYTRCPSCVVLRAGDEILVLSGADRNSTQAIYEALSARCK